MKKVLSIVLSLVLVICMMPVMAFAGTNGAAYSDIAGEKCEGAVSVLSALGVVDGYENGTYKPEQTVTRAEMAKLVITALGMDSYATATKSSYSDMANAQWAIPVVEYATNLGIIEGVGGGRFSPGNPVTYEQAATMIVRAIGFTTDCNEMNGTWPAIYVQKATALGLFENVEGNNYGTGANRGDVAIMLYNALNTPMVYADKDGQTLTKFGKDGNVITMMTTLNKNGSTEYGVLTPEDADDALTNVHSLIGAAGKIIKDKDDKVLSIGDIQTEFLTGEYNKNTGKFTVGDVEYTIAPNAYSEYTAFVTDAGKFTGAGTVKADPQKVIAFRNNKAFQNAADLDTLTKSNKATYTLAVKVSGKTIKNIYSIGYWDASYGSVKKATASQLKKITSDKSLLGYDFAKDDEGAIDTASFILNGVDTLSDIEEDNIVAVYATDRDSAKGVITKVEVGTEVVTGKVTKVKTAADGTKTYTVNDKEYKASSLPGANVTLALGEEATLYLDYAGKIYTTDAVETGYNYAVALKPAGDGDGYDNDKLFIKLLKSDGNAEIFTLKKGVTAANIAEGDLVQYKLNADKEISQIAEADSKITAQTKYNNGVIAGKICADDMVVFVYNGEDSTAAKADADNYDVVKASSLTDDINNAPYFLNSKDDMVAILVDDAATNATDIFGFVNSKSDVQNAKEEDVFQITGVANGAELDKLTKDATGAYNTDYEGFMKFTMSGDTISGIEEVKILGKDSIASEAEFTKDVVMYNGGTKDGTLGTALNEYIVEKVNGDRVLVEGEYQTVKGATVYIPTLKSDNTFDAWTVGSLEDIEIDGYIVLLQTNKKSSNWDTVIFIPDTVARDCADLIK